MKNIKKIIIPFFTSVFLPVFTFAATLTSTPDAKCNLSDPRLAPPFKSIGAAFNYFSCTIVGYIIPFLFTLATAAFIWGIIQFFLNPENEEGRSKGKSFMLWGLIALFVMVSMWGLVGVIGNTFGVKTLLPQLSQ
jgi:hypothetical protein